MRNTANFALPRANSQPHANFKRNAKPVVLPILALNARGNVPDMRGDNPNTGLSYLTGVFIHRSNKDGFAGAPVGKGCLLIVPGDWDDFNDVMDGVKDFKVQIDRNDVYRTTRSLLATKKLVMHINNIINRNNTTIPFRINKGSAANVVVPFRSN